MPFFGDRRVMACTPADIERWLREFTGGQDIRLEPAGGGGGEFRLDAGGWPMRVQVEVMPPRVVALLRMPQLDVRFDYPQERAAEARGWITRFDRHTQRGGG
ncbi:hypothetical protein M6I34_04070 [Burkholderiaceae bacterium FT117]|uniref:hypothetical protein n=1 Tax=Zeimonas sediminis TaxID=2944268 RepID=UPI00234308B5|nr:hypothetical protein [Zeimonas sediminis]MCM5569677.1 hypothetical protein [Zeimonas sediminis]